MRSSNEVGTREFLGATTTVVEQRASGDDKQKNKERILPEHILK